MSARFDSPYQRHASHSGYSATWEAAPLRSVLRTAVDLLLLAVFGLAPFLMGGREPLGQLVLLGLVIAAAVVWTVEQLRSPEPEFRISWGGCLMLLGAGLVFFQFCPLPPDRLAQISPRLPSLIPLMWNSGAEHTGEDVLGLGQWQTVSLAPNVTSSYLAVFLGGILAYFVLLNRVRTQADLKQTVWLLAGAAVAMSCFGLVQFALSNGRYFWIYQHVQATTRFAVVGAFANANHFADFVAVTIPLQIWLLACQARSVPPKSRRLHAGPVSWEAREFAGLRLPVFLCTLGLALSALGIFLSLSRGGIVLALLGAVLTTALLWRKSLVHAGLAGLLAGAALTGLIGTLAFGDLAGKMLEQNFSELATRDVEQLDRNEARRRIWAANMAGIQEFPNLGTGLGTHAYVYQLWYDHPDHGKLCSHAENGYLQIGLETGLIGLGLLALLCLLAVGQSLRVYLFTAKPELAGLGGAVGVGLLIQLLHSLTDFVWYCPACVLLALALGVLANRIPGAAAEDTRPVPVEPGRFIGRRLLWACCLPLPVLLALWAIPLKWRETVAFSRNYQHRMFTELLLREQRSSADSAEEKEKLHRRQIRVALEAIEADPSQHEPQERAGIAYEKLFLLAQAEHPDAMPLIHLQDAARASEFSTDELRAWLQKPGVLGERLEYVDKALAHLRKSLQLCPLQGRAYLEMAGMIWTEGADRGTERKLLEQALQVRPYEARVLFAYGYRVAEDEGLEAALPYLRKGFELGPVLRKSLMTAYAPVVPAAFFLDHFPLNQQSLVQLEEAYREAPDTFGYQKVLQKLALSSVQTALETNGLQAEEPWLIAHQCFSKLQQDRKAYLAAEEAVNANPTSFTARQTLGMWLYEKERYAAAAEHLLWCHRRRPDVDWLRSLTEQAYARSRQQELRGSGGAAPTIQPAAGSQPVPAAHSGAIGFR